MAVTGHSTRMRLAAGLVLTLAIFGAVADETDDSFQAGLSAYHNGEFAQALEVWGRLAEDGHTEAQYSLATLYFSGKGGPTDYERAAHWFRKAAAQNHINSQFNVGIAYWEGKGVEQDVAKAVYWWRRAAEQDFAPAQYNLGAVYYLGKGVDRDLDQARLWFDKAARQGHEQAKNSLAALRSEGVSTAAAPTPPPAPEPAAPPPPAPVAAAPAPAPPPVPAPAPAMRNPDGFVAGRVGSREATVHPGTRGPSPVIARLSPDHPVRIVGRSGPWLEVEIPGGLDVWVFGRFVADEGAIKGDRVRARPLPSTGVNSPPIGFFENGDPVEILEVQGSWKRVRAPEHLSGWVKEDQIVEYPGLPDDWETRWSEAQRNRASASG